MPSEESTNERKVYPRFPTRGRAAPLLLGLQRDCLLIVYL
jgi:hypothetical protein